MPRNIKFKTIATLLFIVLVPWVSGNGNDTIKDRVVVHTPLQNYEQPSLDDYEECHQNRQQCMHVCAGNEKCDAECPRCPELMEEPLLVQGVNDTNYAPPALVPLNTTNIIRLTNNITNIIKSDIHARNEINVQVQQNVSQVGGRFGLGFTEQGSCCYVVRRERECEHQEHCKEVSRQRLCGERCQARVMLAKRVVQCDEAQSGECHELVEYVPARKHKSEAREKFTDCLYGNCNQQGSSRVKRKTCQSCLQLTYAYILQSGMPPQCTGCFQGLAAPMVVMPMWYAPMANFGYNYLPQQHYEFQGNDNDFGEDSGWILDTEKCVNKKGDLVDCMEGSGDEKDLDIKAENNVTDKKDIDDDKEPDYNVPAQRRRLRRRRHNKFVRSLYSHRN